MAHFKFTNDLDVPIFQAIHEGRVCLYGKKQRKRIIHQGNRGGLYVKMNGGKTYLSPSTKTTVIITNGTKGGDNDKRR